MMRLRSMMLACTMVAALAAHGQNTPATATPPSNAGAPAATSPAATSAQGAEAAATANSATRGSRGVKQSSGQGSSRRSAAQTSTPGGQSQPASSAAGITGVPRYRAGFRGQQGTPAPAATAAVVVTGENDGSPAKPTQAAALPGIQLPHNAFGIAKGTPIRVRLQQPVDSAHAKNGQIVRGVLVDAVGNAPAGAPVQLTVVAVAPAGQMTSNGELSLQVISVNGQEVLSEVITAEGKEGPKLLPDDAPGRGTEAVFTPDQPLTLPAG